jgi:hypothetical protein
MYVLHRYKSHMLVPCRDMSRIQVPPSRMDLRIPTTGLQHGRACIHMRLIHPRDPENLDIMYVLHCYKSRMLVPCRDMSRIQVPPSRMDLRGKTWFELEAPGHHRLTIRHTAAVNTHGLFFIRIDM